MTWSDEVHRNRFHTAIARATTERKLRKRGLPVPLMETAKVGPVMVMVALTSGLFAVQCWGGQARAALAKKPLVQQFRSLIFGTSSAAPRLSNSKSSSTPSSNAKVTARKPAVVAPTPSQAAAAAAEARLAANAAVGTQASAAALRMVPPIPSRPALADPQPQASTSAADSSSSSSQQGRTGQGSGSAGSKGGKKKSGKKRR